MSEHEAISLPATWCWVDLDSLGDWAGGGTPSKSESTFWNGGHIPWVSPKDMKTFEIHDSEDHITEQAVLSSTTSKVPPGTVLMVTRSGILRHTFPVSVTRVEVSLNQDLKALIPFEGLNSDFIARSLRAFGNTILHSCTKDGTTVQSIETTALKEFRLPFPPSAEQERIVALIDELLSDLDAGVTALERVQKKLTHYRAAVLKAAVEGDLTADWRAQHPDTEPACELLPRILTERRRSWEEDQLRKFQDAGKEPPKNWKARYQEPSLTVTSTLPELQPGWQWVSLDQISLISGGVTKGQQHRPQSVVRSVPYLRVANVQRGFLDLSEIKSITALESDINDLKLRRGDVLFNEGGDRDKLGRGWIWEEQIPECIHQNHVFRARPVLPELQSKLISWCGNSYGQQWFMRAGKQSVNLASINLTILRSFPVPLPPLAEQEAIVEAVEAQLSVIDHLEADIAAKLKSAQGLRQSILRHAFTGQLVPQDPNDEPASELLRRIATERAERARTAASARLATKTVRKQAKPAAKKAARQRANRLA